MTATVEFPLPFPYSDGTPQDHADALRDHADLRLNGPLLDYAALAAAALIEQQAAEIERLRVTEQERTTQRDRFVAAADKLHGEWLDLKAELATRDKEVLDLMGERDHNEEMADRLAEMLASITGREIGEHSSMNNPWRNALDFGENFMHRQKNAGVKPGEVTR